LKNEEQAKGAVQDSFMAVFKNIITFQGESAFETCLIAITVNTCRATLRRTNRTSVKGPLKFVSSRNGFGHWSMS